MGIFKRLSVFCLTLGIAGVSFGVASGAEHQTSRSKIEVANANAKKTPVPTPTPRGTRGDLQQRRRTDNWDANATAVFGEFEGATAYSLEAIKAADLLVTPNPRLAVYKFDTDAAGAVPKDFFVATTEGAPPGIWRVETNYNAPSGNQLLAQRDNTAGQRYTAVLLEKSPRTRRVDVSARIFVEPLGNDQMAGIVVGSPGTAEGYAMVLDPRNNRIGVDRIVKGRATPLPNRDTVRGALQVTRKIETGRWYHLKLEFDTGDRATSEIVGYLDGVKMFEGRDNVFLEPGFAGLIAAGTTRAQFDTFTITLPENWAGGVVERRERIAEETDARPVVGRSTGTCQKTWSWDFDDLDENIDPPGFTSALLGDGNIGDWKVRAFTVEDPRNVMQLSAQERRHRYVGLLLDERPFADFEVSARLRTISGKSDHRQAGLVFRQVDGQNYYYATLNTGRETVTLTRVANGMHQQLASHKMGVKNRNFHILKVVADGSNIRVLVDNDTKIRATDNTFEVGRVGFITHSDTVAQFDDLKVCDFRLE